MDAAVHASLGSRIQDLSSFACATCQFHFHKNLHLCVQRIRELDSEVGSESNSSDANNYVVRGHESVQVSRSLGRK